MSRIGKLPIPVPDGVDVALDGLTVNVKGPKGELTRTMPEGVTLSRDDDGAVVVTRTGESRTERSRHGLVRTLIANMIEGVTNGYAKSLELVGVGYRAASKGSDVELQVGFSHPVTIEAPEGILIEVPQPTRITVSGIDKVLVGQIAANIRKVRPPEPYKGKGIKYEGEHIRRKAGKAAGR
ncbi:MAG: 50S ribosomal protein L6 [Actinobacteria bacterium]|jgi:large subunit ribosomal protein L6|nr:50S ribosomal protein L6 [Actinomycetota bacterium]